MTEFERGREDGYDAYFDGRSCLSDDSDFVDGWWTGYYEAENDTNDSVDLERSGG